MSLGRRACRVLAGRRSRRSRVAFAFAFALFLSQAGCHATQRQYERRGIAGAITTLGGVATGLVGRSMIQNQDDPTAGVVVATVGAVAQVVGVVLLIHALDGVIQPPPEFQPVHRWVDARPASPHSGAIMPHGSLPAHQSPGE